MLDTILIRNILIITHKFNVIYKNGMIKKHDEYMMKMKLYLRLTALAIQSNMNVLKITKYFSIEAILDGMSMDGYEWVQNKRHQRCW